MLENGLFLERFELLAHVPRSDGPFEVLVAVHGISRNAEEIFRAFSAVAGERLIVLAPHFDATGFPDYQRLGLRGRGLRADLVLDAALERFEATSGYSMRRFHLFGFSGGAQFAHRYAMHYPHRIASLHVASAGWYTFPDPAEPWPYGLGGRNPAHAVATQLPHFRAVPKTVYVGGQDTERDPALRTGARIDRQQGRNRVERARNWAAAVGDVELVEIPGAAHSFIECCHAVHRGLQAQVAERCKTVPSGCVSARRHPARHPNGGEDRASSGSGV